MTDREFYRVDPTKMSRERMGSRAYGSLRYICSSAGSFVKENVGAFLAVLLLFAAGGLIVKTCRAHDTVDYIFIGRDKEGYVSRCFIISKDMNEGSDCDNNRDKYFYLPDGRIIQERVGYKVHKVDNHTSVDATLKRMHVPREICEDLRKKEDDR